MKSDSSLHFRVNKGLKEAFKKKCDLLFTTPSRRISEFMLTEVGLLNKDSIDKVDTGE